VVQLDAEQEVDPHAVTALAAAISLLAVVLAAAFWMFALWWPARHGGEPAPLGLRLGPWIGLVLAAGAWILALRRRQAARVIPLAMVSASTGRPSPGTRLRVAVLQEGEFELKRLEVAIECLREVRRGRHWVDETVWQCLVASAGPQKVERGCPVSVAGEVELPQDALPTTDDDEPGSVGWMLSVLVEAKGYATVVTNHQIEVAPAS